MPYGILDVVKDLMTNNLDYVKPHIKDARALVCLGCEYRQSIPGTRIGMCKSCGCFLDAKCSLTRASCPHDKWEK